MVGQKLMTDLPAECQYAVAHLWCISVLTISRQATDMKRLAQG